MAFLSMILSSSGDSEPQLHGAARSDGSAESNLRKAAYIKRRQGSGMELDVTSTESADGNSKGEDMGLSCDHSLSSSSSTGEAEDPFDVPGKLGVVPLAVMVFYSVSGGPFGCEAAVRSSGNLFTLAGFLFAPLIWSVQEAYVTAELGSAFPDSSGGVAWVETAFGGTAGWMAGYLGWISGATDNAIYPVLFLDYLLEVIKSEDDQYTVHPLLRFLLLASTSIILAYINWLGLPVVGRMSVTICLVAMSPFIILTVVGAFKVQPQRWFQIPSEDSVDLLLDSDAEVEADIAGGVFPNLVVGGVLWRPYLNNLFWNLNSFDSAASFSADIGTNPGYVLPTAMGYAVVMVVAGYFLPLLVALGASDADQHDWVDGYLARVASDVVGPWLGAWTVFAAGISNIALFQAELSADAFQLMGMAERGYLPELFTVRSRHGTPTAGILLGTLVIIVMSVSNLDQLIEMLNFNYAISLLMEYFAFIKLRLSRPDMHRPYRIPLSTTSCIVLLVPTIAFTVLVLCLATYETFVFSIFVNVLGILLYKARGAPSEAAADELHQNDDTACPRQHQQHRRIPNDDTDDVEMMRQKRTHRVLQDGTVSTYQDHVMKMTADPDASVVAGAQVHDTRGSLTFA